LAATGGAPVRPTPQRRGRIFGPMFAFVIISVPPARKTGISGQPCATLCDRLRQHCRVLHRRCEQVRTGLDRIARKRETRV
jgi:hypothetical protein